MTKEKLLFAVAAAALAAGTSALAQQENRSSPAERSAPSTTNKPSAGGVQQNRSEPGGRSGQAGRSETTGQAPQEHPNAGPKASEENKAGQGGPERARRSEGERPSGEKNDRSGRTTTGQERQNSTTGQASPSERRNDIDRRNDAERRDGVDRDRAQGERNENRARVNEGRSGDASGHVTVNLSDQQRTRIREVIVKERSAPRVNDVNFSLSIGTPVPRTVQLVRLPPAIIEIEPRWRGFEYFLVGDELVVVDPNDMQIVAVLPA